MKNIVAFSGGKDSLALLIWVINTKGKENLEVVFCDTGWEAEETYKHIKEVEKKSGIKVKVLKSSKYADFEDLSIKKKRVASTKARFCTEELKVKPMIDFILGLKEHCIIYQGIRADESFARSKMEAQCQYFKFYTQPKRYKKDGTPVYDYYRKKEVLEYIKQYAVEVERPLLSWTADEVFEYIKKNDYEPNALYKQGFGRVGCFPCVMCRHGEIVNIAKKHPERIEKVRELEEKVGTFFPPNYIPKWACSNGKYPTIDDVMKYKNVNSTQEEMFDPPSCESIYNICE